jgi:hypothetical protein
VQSWISPFVPRVPVRFGLLLVLMSITLEYSPGLLPASWHSQFLIELFDRTRRCVILFSMGTGALSTFSSCLTSSKYSQTPWLSTSSIFAFTSSGLKRCMSFFAFEASSGTSSPFFELLIWICVASTSDARNYGRIVDLLQAYRTHINHANTSPQVSWHRSPCTQMAWHPRH